MANDIPDEIILNGVNASEKSANRGKYLLTLAAADLEQLALRQTYGKRHLAELRRRGSSGLEELAFGLDANNLAEAGWGVIFPARADTASVAAIRDALGELLAWRQAQAGEHYRLYEGANGYQTRETADKFMRRHGAAPGTVDPAKLPYYLLIVGDANEIPFRFQYELDATYLVGRVYFDTLAEYARYAHSVVEAEKSDLRLPRRAVFFGTRHAGDRATDLSSTMLVDPLAKKLRVKMPDWQIERVPVADCTKARLSGLLGGGDAPALLFTASHGVGFDNGDPLQLPFQGGLLCQDLEAIDESIGRRHYVGAEDIADDFQMHGLVNFHFACYGLGTPQRDSFTRPDRTTPQTIAPRDFLSALPRRLLGHPNGGALAVIGHVDRAWTYSFKWGEAVEQTQTFQDTLQRLMSGQRVGMALDQFNNRYAQIAVRLTGMIDIAEELPPDPSTLAGLWAANNDARGYALLGDPAVALPVARDDQLAGERPAAAPIVVDVSRAVAPPATDTATPPPTDAPAPPPAPDEAALRRQLQLHLKTLAAQLDTFAADLAVPGAADDFAADDFGVFDREKLSELGEKLRQTMAAVGDRLAEFANDVISLEVRTYTSEAIEDEKWEDGKFSKARQRARTHIKLDGDTDIVVPIEAGELDEVIWDIHSRAVEQAQANRVAMLKAVGELLTALVPTSK